MKRGSPPEPALRPEIHLLFVLPVRSQGQERFVPALQVKVRPGGGSQHTEPSKNVIVGFSLHETPQRAHLLTELRMKVAL